MALENAFDKLRDGLEDLGSLEIRSFSGDVTAVINSGAGNQSFKTLFDKAIKDGKISLKMYTRLDADGDSDHFIADSGIDDGMAAGHIAAFQMGQEIRRSYIELFRDVAQRIVK
ncbi:MAG: hypothetical protein AB8B85_23815 [Paracoccaceae bacterium]